MQRSDSLLKLVSFLVFLTLAVYIGYSAYQSHADPFKTVLATEYEMSDSVSTTGYIVRDEECLSASGSVVITAEEGSKVSAYEAVAAKYVGTSAIEKAEEIRELKLEIEQLEKEMVGTDRITSAKENVLTLSKMLAAGDISGVDSVEMTFRSCLSPENSTLSIAEIESEIELLEARIDQLERSASSDVTEIYSNKAGIFSMATDGCETVGIDDIYDMTPDQLREAFDERTTGDGVVGKLVYGVKWYYAAVLNENAVKRLGVGDTVTVRFSREYSNTIPMTVESVGSEREGKCVVVFSYSKYLQNMVTLREATAEIIFSRQSGIRVPKSSIHLEEGKTCLYILDGMKAKRVYVTILATEEDYYLVESENNGLREGNQIIASGKGLYDGKVVV